MHALGLGKLHMETARLYVSFYSFQSAHGENEPDLEKEIK